MKGVVFTEFLEMVEKEFGYEVVDRIINNTELPSKGVYTAIGTYAHGEMVSLVTSLSADQNIPVPELLKSYGQYFHQTALKKYPEFFERAEGLFDFLESVENYIHVEVRKLYPGAELPHFETTRDNDNSMIMVYRSKRKMSDFAEGLIQKSIMHYGDNYTFSKENIAEDGSIVKFIFQRKS